MDAAILVPGLSEGGAPWGAQGPELADQDFRAMRDLIFKETGIALVDAKKDLVRSRLSKRLRHWDFKSFGEYHEHLTAHDPNGEELRLMINCITTNKTEFFREEHHFDFLRQVVLPQWQEQAAEGRPRRLRIWSAGCSTGEEPYSLALIVRENLKPGVDWDVKILASDIDTDVLHQATHAVYPEDRLRGFASGWKEKYFLRGTGAYAGQVRARSELRDLITFRRINLVQEPWPIHTHFDVIFCRNVMIYFNRPTQQRLLERFASYLREGGYLVLGHSENLHWLTDQYQPVGQTIYQVCPRSTPCPASATSALPTPREVKHQDAPLPLSSIQAGEIFASRQPACVTTLLGSCVATCLFDPETRIGGMNHFMLPGGTKETDIPSCYGIHAMELLINEIMKLGGDRRRLQAKIFGGAQVVANAGTFWNVGSRNQEFIKQFLATERIPIVAKCLGGATGLNLRYFTHTGIAQVRPLQSSILSKVMAQESSHGREVLRQTQEPLDNKVTLF